MSRARDLADIADYSFDSERITSVGDPTAAQDVATKNYVDTATSAIGESAEKVIVTVDNKSGTTLSKGTPVHIVGATGNTFHIEAARADSDGAMPASGILQQELTADQEGSMVVTGFVNGIDTSSFAAGDEIYVAATGGYTNVAPTGESNLLQKLGVVSKVDASNGAILLQGAGRTNAVPNLDDDQFFLGNGSNQAVATDFSTAVEAISINNIVEDTTPQLGGELDTNGNDVSFGDNDKAIFGAGDDLQIYHDGSHSYIDEQGTGSLQIRATNLNLKSSTNETYIGCVADGQVEINYNNSLKLATTSTGIDVTGTITFDGGTTSADLNFGDNDKAIFGAGSDLEIYHQGGYSYIHDNGTGPLYIRATDLILKSAADNDDYAKFIENGAVELYYSNAKKLATTNTGVDVTGTVTADGLTSSGDLSVTGVASIGADAGGEANVLTLKGRTSDNDGYIKFTSSDGATSYAYTGVPSANTLAFYTNGFTERMRITDTGNVGIGTTPESWVTGYAGNVLQVGDAAVFGGSTNDSMSYMLANAYYDSSDSRWEYINTDFATRYEQLDGQHLFYTAASGTADAAITWSEAMRITSGGDLLIGTTDTSPSNNSAGNANDNGTAIGYGLIQSAAYKSTANAGSVAYLNRTGTDGDIAQFFKDGSTVGSIGTNASDMYLGTGIAGIYFLDGGSNPGVIPYNAGANATSDGALDLGDAVYRWKDLYLSGKGYFSGGTDEKIVLSGATNPYIRWQEGTTNKAYMQWNSAGYIYIANSEDGSALRIKDDLDFSLDGSTFYSIWHEGNDGSGSGLDADTVDGIQGASFLRSDADDSHAGTLTLDVVQVGNEIRLPNNTSLTDVTLTATSDQDTGFNWSGSNAVSYISGGVLKYNLNNVWHSGNDGSGSGLDADTVDGQHASAFLTSIPDNYVLNTGDTMTGSLTTPNLFVGDGTDGEFYSDAAGRTAFRNGDFYLQSSVGNFYCYAGNIYLGNSGDNVYVRGNPMSGDFWSLTGAGVLSLAANTTDVLNFTAGSTNDSRGISFNSRTALSADYNDGWMRLNQNSEFTNGTYSPKRISSSEQIVAGNSTVTSGGQLVVSASTNPYLSFHESATRRAYIQYLTTDHNILHHNEEGYTHRFQTNQTSCGLTLYTSGSALRGYVYANNSDEIGFLDADGDWAIKHVKDSRTEFYINNTEYAEINSDYLTHTSDIRTPIFYDSNDTNYFGDFASTSYVKYLGRRAHNTGHLVGSYNSVGANDAKSNPIYVIGSSYNPGDQALSNMYGIGYSHPNQGSMPSHAGGWGMYVAADGDSRVFLDGSNGRVIGTSAAYIPIYYDYNDTNYYADPAGNSRTNTEQTNYLGLGTAANTSGTYRLNMAGHIDMNNNSVNYCEQIHFNDNLRFYDEGNDNYLIFKYGDTASGGIRMLDGDGAVQSWWYGDGSGRGGLLDNDGHWAVRIQTGTSPLELRCDNNVEFYVYNSYTYSPGSSRAPIFYDSNNTAYYTNPTNTSVLNDIYLEGEIFHNGDTNTYLQFHASDQFRVVTGGAERFEVNNSQITSTEPIHAPSFHGDGSNLTNVASSANVGLVGIKNLIFGGNRILNFVLGSTITAGTPVWVKIEHSGNPSAWRFNQNTSSQSQGWYYPVTTNTNYSGNFNLTDDTTAGTTIIPTVAMTTLNILFSTVAGEDFDAGNEIWVYHPNPTSSTFLQIWESGSSSNRLQFQLWQ